MGIAISAVQPFGIVPTATSQTPSQSRLTVDDVPPPGPRTLPLVRNLLLELRSVRARGEHVTGPGVVEGIEDDLKTVLVQNPVRVTPHLGRNNAVWIGVVSANTHVEIFGVVQDKDLGSFGGRRSFLRLLLNELVDHGGLLPDGVIQHAVEHGPLVHPNRWHLVKLPAFPGGRRLAGPRAPQVGAASCGAGRNARARPSSGQEAIIIRSPKATLLGRGGHAVPAQISSKCLVRICHGCSVRDQDVWAGSTVGASQAGSPHKLAGSNACNKTMRPDTLSQKRGSPRCES